MGLLVALALSGAMAVRSEEGPGRLAEPLRHTLRRPVTCVDASAPGTLDFYEPPCPAPGREVL